MAYRICSCGRKISQPVNSSIWPKRCVSCDRILKEKRSKKIEKVSTKGVNLKPKSKNPSLRTVNIKLDEAWSLLVKVRANFKCEYCGSEQTLNSHHIYSRANISTRWNPTNGICLCVNHHTFSNKFSAHRTPIEFTQWLESIKGVDFTRSLKFEAKKRANFDIYDRIEMLEKLKEEIKSLKTSLRA